MTLASRSQVAAALGLGSEGALSAGQVARVDALIARVSAMVEREAQRSFTAGAVEARMIVTDSRIYLEQVGSVQSVTDMGGDLVDHELVGGWLTVTRNGCHIPSGTQLAVEYTRGNPPAGVAGLVAGVVARLLTVEPGSPESQASDITAGADFRVRLADWVSSTAVMTPDEIAEARSFRSRIPNTIIHRL